MIEHYNYMLKHWKEYNLTDTKEDFIALLNILEAHGETIDSLHHAVFNCYDFFCDYWFCDVQNDRDAVEVIFNFNRFIDNVEDLKEFLYEELQDLRDDDYFTREEQDRIFKEDYCDDENPDSIITKTRDGYVHSVRY